MSQSDAAASLLTLSMAASTAAPIPVHQRSTSSNGLLETGVGLASSGAMQAAGSSIGSPKTHRRLASTGRSRRRLSDAREAAARPSGAILHASPPALSMASLSLSTSPPSTTNVAASLTGAAIKALSSSVPLNDGSNFPHAVPASTESLNPKPIPIGSGKKRGVEHKCESCSKIYRHPSCLIKHRWEHTPHWREASKFVLSKHQQVQLLEAAAILSHLSPASSSLPDDRSLWPSFLSGGSLPPPDLSTLMSTPESVKRITTNTTGGGGIAATATAAGVSSSVPVGATATYTRSSSTGPRMHDFSIPVNSTSAIRPGLFGVPTPTSNGGANVPVTSDPAQAQPMSVPITTSLSSHSWSSVGVSQTNNNHIDSFSVGTGTGGWSLPRSSVRSISGSSRSRSGSASDIDEQEEEHDNAAENGDEVGDDDSGSVVDDEFGSYGSSRRFSNGKRGYGFGAYSHHRTPQPKMWKREDDDMGIGGMSAWSLREEDEYLGNKKEQGGEKKEWDDMEMEMDMD